MAFEKITLAQLRQRIIADIELHTGQSASQRGDIYYPIAMAHAGACYGLHGHLDYNGDQLFDDSADDEHLLLRAAEMGVYQIPAYRASGEVTITGNNAAIIPAGSLFKRGDVFWRVTADATVIEGVATLNLRALRGGSDGNQPAGAQLSLATTVAGIDSTATVINIAGGADIETIARLRERLSERKQNPPMGGNADDYVRWAKEAHPDVTRAWCYSNENGYGTVVVRFVTDNLASPIPSPAHIAAVKAYIDTKRPAGMAGFEVGALIENPLNLTFTLLDPPTSAVKQAVQAELDDMIKRKAVPGGEIKRSWIHEAISTASGENDHAITLTTDVTSAANELITLGTITWP